MSKLGRLVQKMDNFERLTAFADMSQIMPREQQIKAVAGDLFGLLSYVIHKPDAYRSKSQAISDFMGIEMAGKYDIDTLPRLQVVLRSLGSITDLSNDFEKSNWLKHISPTISRLSDLVRQQIADLNAWRENAFSDVTGKSERADMTKYGSLLKRVEFFEKVASYGDRESFLKSLSQENPDLGPGLTNFPEMQVHPSAGRVIEELGPGLSQFPGMEVHPTRTPKPPTTGPILPLPKDGDYINPEVQKALIKLFPGSEKWIKVDSVWGPNTRGAVNRYKATFHDDREMNDPAFQRDLITKSQMPTTASETPFAAIEKMAVKKKS